MMLNYSFKEVKDLLTINGATYATYKEAYTIYSLIHNYNNDAYRDVIEPGDNNESKSIDNNEFQNEDVPKEVIANLWDALAQLLSNHDEPSLYVLGDRSVD